MFLLLLILSITIRAMASLYWTGLHGSDIMITSLFSLESMDREYPTYDGSLIIIYNVAAMCVALVVHSGSSIDRILLT